MAIDKRRVSQRHLAGMLAPRRIAGQFQLRPEALVQHMEGGDDGIEDVYPHPVVPHLVEAPLVRRRTHDLSTLESVVEVTLNGGGLAEEGTVRERQGRGLAPRVHLEMFPAALLADWRHIVDRFIEPRSE